jgi:hypothetical protein
MQTEVLTENCLVFYVLICLSSEFLVLYRCNPVMLLFVNLSLAPRNLNVVDCAEIFIINDDTSIFVGTH